MQGRGLAIRVAEPWRSGHVSLTVEGLPGIRFTPAGVQIGEAKHRVRWSGAPAILFELCTSHRALIRLPEARPPELCVPARAVAIPGSLSLQTDLDPRRLRLTLLRLPPHPRSLPPRAGDGLSDLQRR